MWQDLNIEIFNPGFRNTHLFFAPGLMDAHGNFEDLSGGDSCPMF